MGQYDWVKKEIESELLDVFVDSYRLITGRTIKEIETSESPDFLAMIDGQRGGVEISELRVDAEPDPYAYVGEAWRIAEKKHISYTKHGRFTIPIILVLFAAQPPLYDFHEGIANLALEDFDGLGFSEVWFADLSDEYFSSRDPRRPADLYGVTPERWRGFHRYGDWGRKPYG
ncbi:MAG: hypothetical protein ACFCUQ_18050 [Kiloniellales bacterium]